MGADPTDTRKIQAYVIPGLCENLTQTTTMTAEKQLTVTVRGVYGRPLPALQMPYPDMKNIKGDQVFVRRRLNTKTSAGSEFGPEGPDHAHFIPEDGLVGHDMYHTNYHLKNWKVPERAVLMQSLETYLELVYHDQFGHYLRMVKGDTKGESIELVLDNPMFGEQVIVEGADPSQICIGDVFAATDRSTSLVLQVATPRYPCNYVDRKFESPFGEKGLRRHTLNEASAGWFCRVLEEGNVSWISCLESHKYTILVLTHHDSPTACRRNEITTN